MKMSIMSINNTALELKTLWKIPTVNSMKETHIAMKMSFYATKLWICYKTLDMGEEYKAFVVPK